jgi:hypothetical protein
MMPGRQLSLVVAPRATAIDGARLLAVSTSAATKSERIGISDFLSGTIREVVNSL